MTRAGCPGSHGAHHRKESRVASPIRIWRWAVSVKYLRAAVQSPAPRSKSYQVKLPPPFATWRLARALAERPHPKLSAKARPDDAGKNARCLSANHCARSTIERTSGLAELVASRVDIHLAENHFREGIAEVEVGSVERRQCTRGERKISKRGGNAFKPRHWRDIGKSDTAAPLCDADLLISCVNMDF